jgi:peptidoglycan/xylan/chitin deacetylase (PgdA/CDA1 family)
MLRPKPIIVLSFDDGTIIEYAIIKLAKMVLGLPSTLFLITGLSRHPHTDEPILISYPEKIKELVKLGVEIASHTHTHRDLTTLSIEEVERELTRSKLLIEKISGSTPLGFAYPYGHYNDLIRRCVLKHYKYARIYDFKINTQLSDLTAISSIDVKALKVIVHLVCWILRMRKTYIAKRKIMIVLVLHSPQTTADTLITFLVLVFVAFLKISGSAVVLTLKDAIKILLVDDV